VRRRGTHRLNRWEAGIDARQAHLTKRDERVQNEQKQKKQKPAQAERKSEKIEECVDTAFSEGLRAGH
jgi:hypothetical protein